MAVVKSVAIVLH